MAHDGYKKNFLKKKKREENTLKTDTALCFNRIKTKRV